MVVYADATAASSLPSVLDGVDVQAVETDMLVARTDPKARQPRPVRVGVSTGHPDITAGTIGARVTDGINVYALSNNHVYADGNAASIGDGAIQPGTVDGGTDPADRIGTLHDFEPIDFTGGDNLMDAAIVISSIDLLGNSTPADDGYGTPSSTLTSASVGMSVQKYGRTTGLTVGEIEAVNVTVNICYERQGPRRCKKLARFVDQITITPGVFSDGGDSGSLIVTTASNSPVGLLFAGSSSRTIANKIDLVVSRFNVTIDDSEPIPVVTESISGTVTDDSDGTPVGGANVSADTGQAATTAGDGTYTIADVPAGARDVTAVAAGYETQAKATTVVENQTSTVDFALTQATVANQVIVTRPSGEQGYATEGGKDSDKHLLITVALEDDLGNPVGGASVSILADYDSGPSAIGTATTGSDGTVTFSWKNAPSGCLTTTVTNVNAAGPSWDGSTPVNGFCK